MRGPLGERRFDVDVEELLTKTEFTQTVGGEKTINTENGLGVCPYVILRHRDDGHEFGTWAYKGSEDIIHNINWLISNQGRAVYASNPLSDTLPMVRQNLNKLLGVQ